MLDAHGQPSNTNLNHSRNVTKSLMSLQGILKGLVTDQTLNEIELIFLTTWLESHRSLTNDVDLSPLLDSVKSVISDSVITNTELDFLKSQIDNSLADIELIPNCVEDLTNELLGFVSGISADNVVTEKEMIGLLQWLSENPESMNCWPGNILAQKLSDILEDNVIDQDELEDLTQTCKIIAGQQFLETGAAGGMSTYFCTTAIDSLPVNVANVCFTGKFLMGSRNALHGSAEELGLKPLKDVTQNLHLLVIGSLASADWRFSSHGRKIEKALLNQQKGFNTMIITEENWANISKLNKSGKSVFQSPAVSFIEDSSTVCFTGFPSKLKNELIEFAINKNLIVVTKITIGLDILVFGDNAGPKKMELAQKQGVKCLDKDQFLNYVYS